MGVFQITSPKILNLLTFFWYSHWFAFLFFHKLGFLFLDLVILSVKYQAPYLD